MTEDEQKKKEEQLEDIVAEAPKTEQTEKSKGASLNANEPLCGG